MVACCKSHPEWSSVAQAARMCSLSQVSGHSMGKYYFTNFQHAEAMVPIYFLDYLQKSSSQTL